MASARTNPGGIECDNEDRTALDGLEKRLFELVSKGATSQQWAEWLRAPLEHAAAAGDKELAMILLKAGADGSAGWEGCGGRTLLSAAAEGGNADIVSAVLDAGGLEELNVASCDDEMTPIHKASSGGHAAAARALLIEGADVNLVDSQERNMLHCALDHGHFQLARDVMIAGADLNARDANGDTPLHLAVAHDDDSLIRTLLHRGAVVNAANDNGEHPLHLAIEHGHTSVARALLKAGADANARSGDDGWYSPLQLARSSLAMTQLLLKHGADVESSDDLGFGALHEAAGYGSASVVDALVEAGANLEAKTTSVTFEENHYFEGLTPLHVAAFWRNFECAAALVRKGANINAKDEEGRTPLHTVCTSSAGTHAPEMADLLLRCGADETATDKDGKTPQDVIEEDTDLAGQLRRLLVNAPADRVWRRRGMLVLCRARSPHVSRRKRVRGVNSDLVISRVVGLEADAIFRRIVGFL